MEVRAAFGFRECTQEDQAQFAQWLAAELCRVELNRDRLAAAVVVARCRNDGLEPPALARVTRLVASAVNAVEEGFCATMVERLSAASRTRLDDLVAEDDGDEGSVGGGQTFFTKLKADPGALGLDSLLTEVIDVDRGRQAGVPVAADLDGHPPMGGGSGRLAEPSGRA